MILLAAALIAQDYPAFNRVDVEAICAVKVAGAYSEVYDSVEECVTDHYADYRRFVLLTKRSGAILAPAFGKCIDDWTKDGKVDWGMVSMCAVDMVNGKRDVDMFSRAAPRALRPKIDACVKYWTDEETRIVDWDMAGTCASKVDLSGL